MTTYSIEPSVKKSITMSEQWYNQEKNVTVTITDVWRWGRWFINLQENEELPVADDDRAVLYLDIYEDVEMDFVDDGVGRWVEVIEEMDEEAADALVEEVESILEEDGYGGLEEAGWEYADSSTSIIGPLIIKEVE